MGDSRQSSIRRVALAVAALGLALWIGSIAVPYLWGEDRGWTAEKSKAYEDAGAKLHAMLEGMHDHSEDRHFENEEVERAYAESHRETVHQHVHVDPEEFKKAQAEFLAQKEILEEVRTGNRFQVGILFWSGVSLMGVGAISFFAANHAVE